jgi:uncharacterized protein (TIGR00297 family)
MVSFPPRGVTLVVLLILVTIMVICVRTKKLTIPAALLAGLIGCVVALGTGVTGFLSLIVFFGLGVWATSHRKDLKARITAEGVHPEGRKASQVFANGGVAAIVSLIACFDREHLELYSIMVAGSLASALADTWSSELGMVYGRHFFNICTFRREPKGLDGVISLEGTLIGMAGAGIVGILYDPLTMGTLVVLVAGTMGNIADSLLGATLERRHVIGNDTVNFLNTLLAALIAMGLYFLLI